MLQVVIPIFLVILVGYGFGKKHQFAAEAEKLINEYVLYIALPALLFLAVARANPTDLAQWPFILATLAGIAVAYLAGVGLAKAKGVSAPQSSLVGMASCYGTTGYMGIPILIAALGPKAAVPAAIATILHNIPAIITVIVTHDLSGQKQSNPFASAGRALITTLKNPLTLAVAAGALFSLLRIPLPSMLVSFSGFLGAAAGPTALFALGLGLARIPFSRARLAAMAGWVMPVALIKIVLQPLVTFGVIAMIFAAKMDIWFATAVVMAAQPIGAGAYVFGKKYGFFSEETSLAIIVSLLATLMTLTIILQFFSSALPA
jgi:malonate transporter and related proteins